MRKITLGHLDISDIGKAYVNDVLNSNRLSSGKYTEMFEREFARLHDCEHAIFLNSGTSALQVALAVLKEVYHYEDGDEVLVPATTFIATSNIVLQNNLKPVFVDVDPYTYNMDPNLIRAKITFRTRAIIPVHLFGLPAELNAIKYIANYNGLQMIEDSCETMFSCVYGKSVGSWGQMGCFSTYIAHLIVGGIGGIITTNDSYLASLCRSSMAHGRDSIYTNIDHDDSENKDVLKDMVQRRFRFERIGYSYRATEMEAAIALSELNRWAENITTRRMNAQYLTSLLRDLSHKLQLPTKTMGENSFMVYPMVLDGDHDRDEFLLHLEMNGIETRYMFPLLSQPIYQKLFPGEASKHPVASRLEKQGFFIGIHQGLTMQDLDYVSEVIHGFFQENAR